MLIDTEINGTYANRWDRKTAFSPSRRSGWMEIREMEIAVVEVFFAGGLVFLFMLVSMPR